MNIIAYLYLIIALLGITCGIIVYLNNSTNKLAKFFLFFTAAGFYWGFTGFLLRIANNFQEALFFQKIGSLWPICIALFFHFGYYYCYGEPDGKRKYLLYSILYIPALFFSIIEIFTDQITRVVLSPLGYWTSTFPESSILYIMSIAWSFIISVSIILIIFQYITRQYDKKKRNQGFFIFIGCLITVVLSLLSETFLPLFSLPVIKLTVPGFGIGLLFIGYSIYKYELFTLTPTHAADKILDNIHEIVILTDKNLCIQSANPVLFQLLGYRKEEVINRNIEHFLTQEQQTKLITQGFFDFNKETSPIYTELQLKNGGSLTVELSKTIVNDSSHNTEGMIFLARDVSYKQKKEQQINRYIHELENRETAMVSMLEDLHLKQKEIEDMNKSLESKVRDRTETIEQMLRQKDEFINQLGHDLKNPLGPLVNLLPIVEQQEDDPKQKEMLKVVNRNVSYMKNLVTKTIQLAQLKSPNTMIKKECFDLNHEVNEILETNKFLFDEKSITIENLIPKNVFVDADKLKIQEVFHNILNNSVKYTDKIPTTITIDQKREDDWVLISITDMGIGMTQEQIDNVFNEFYKADSSRHDFESSGLGMPITKRVIELHGGRIWVESDGPGKGSTFYFTLPMKQQDKNQDFQINNSVNNDIGRL